MILLLLERKLFQGLTILGKREREAKIKANKGELFEGKENDQISSLSYLLSIDNDHLVGLLSLSRSILMPSSFILLTDVQLVDKEKYFSFSLSLS